MYASKSSPCIDTHLQDINRHGIMRFINHDENNCNVKFMKLKNHVFVVALKDIAEGEELLIDYNNHQNYTRGDEQRIDDSNDELVFSNNDDEDTQAVDEHEDTDAQPQCHRCGKETNSDKLVLCCFRRKRGKRDSAAKSGNCQKFSCFKCLGWTKRRSDKVYCHYVSSSTSY